MTESEICDFFKETDENDIDDMLRDLTMTTYNGSEQEINDGDDAEEPAEADDDMTTCRLRQLLRTQSRADREALLKEWEEHTGSGNNSQREDQDGHMEIRTTWTWT